MVTIMDGAFEKRTATKYVFLYIRMGVMKKFLTDSLIIFVVHLQFNWNNEISLAKINKPQTQLTF